MGTGPIPVESKRVLNYFDTKETIVREDPNGTGAMCTTVLYSLFCTTIHTTVENTGSRSTYAPKRTIKRHLNLKERKKYIFCTCIGVIYVFMCTSR